MRKIFSFYSPLSEEIIIRIKSEIRSIQDITDIYHKIAFGPKLLRKIDSLPADFILHLKPSSKRINKQRRFPPCYLNFSYSNNRDKSIFLFSTPMGSQVKIDYLKRYVKGSIIKGDSLLEYLMLKINFFVFILSKLFRIHAAWIKRGKRSFFLVGERGVGKTTLTRLLLKEDKKSRLIEDDCTFIFPRDNIVHAFSPDRMMYHFVTHLFFVEKKINNLSEIYPISSKEAFKRIVFHSDILLKKDDTKVEYRLETLEKLVLGCQCFVLVNGRGLKDNSKKLERLLAKALY